MFDHDTRFLSRLELLIGGAQPLLLGSSVRDDNVMLSVDLTNADIFEGGHIVLPRDTIHVVRTVYLWRGVAYQRIAVSNHGDSFLSFTLTLLFGNDFADIFEVRGQLRPKRGEARDELRGDNGVTLVYRGLDGAERRTELTSSPRRPGARRALQLMSSAWRRAGPSPCSSPWNATALTCRSEWASSKG